MRPYHARSTTTRHEPGARPPTLVASLAPAGLVASAAQEDSSPPIAESDPYGVAMLAYFALFLALVMLVASIVFVIRQRRQYRRHGAGPRRPF